MKTRVQSLWESVRNSLWFIPSLMTAAAVVTAFGMTWFDKASPQSIWGLRQFLYPGGPEGARQMLSTIAGSTITVTGVTFSITLAALVGASSMFGPRLLRSFMGDRGNQTVLGMFVGTFVYSLLVLRAIRDNADAEFVPRAAVTFSIVLSIASFAVLIYFFHHSSTLIQAEHVVDTLYREVVSVIDEVFPEEQEPVAGIEMPFGHPPELEPSESPTTIFADASGYLRAVDEEGLLTLAVHRDLVIRSEYRSGDFVFEGTPLAVAGGKGAIDEHVQKQVRRAFILGRYRSIEQDVEFPLQQLVDMALRALSPSMNDPYTAVNCIDRLGAAICYLNARQPASPYRCGESGRLRLVLDVYTYEGMVDAAFNQIRQSAQSNIAVCIRLLEALQAIAVTIRRDEQRSVIRRHAEMIHRTGHEAAMEESDRNDLEQRFQQVMEKLGQSRP